MQQSGTSPPDVDVLNRLLNGAPGIRNWTGPTEHTSGDLVGPWRLTERLGAGGMASVWMAERIDGMLGRPAAIKLPSEGWYGRSLALRLEREREILGGLAHPNIARLLDAGVTRDRQPYLVLEYVEGLPIDEYCRERKLSVRNRLELFLQAAGAISYAHRSLVVHRDIKPENILVTADGTVQVLDFGIATMLEGTHAYSTPLTEIAGRAMTPEYASPEQLRGDPITVASDVYSLGVLLYKVICGVLPYDAGRPSRAALEEAIATCEPTLPSRRMERGPERKYVAGDLDSVIMKALKKPLEDRYPTVDAFIDDIRRFLENRPVTARPHRWSYCAHRYISRHRAAAAATVAILVSVIAGLTVALWQARVARQQTRSAESAKKFVVSTMLDAHSYWGTGKPASALELLRQAKTHIHMLDAADAETKVELRSILGATLLSLQDTANASTLLEVAVEQAGSLDRGHPQRLRAHLLRLWAEVFRGRAVESRQAADDLLVAMRHGRPLPEDLAGALRCRAMIAGAAADPPRALEFASQALRVAEARLGSHHNQSVLALVELSRAHAIANHSAEALQFARVAMDRSMKAYGGRATHPNVMRARAALAAAQALSGRRKAAIAQFERLIEDGIALFGPSSRTAGQDLLSMASLQAEAGLSDAARSAADQGVSILRQHYASGSSGYAAALAICDRMRNRDSLVH